MAGAVRVIGRAKAYIIMAYIARTHMVMACIVRAHTAMAYINMPSCGQSFMPFKPSGQLERCRVYHTVQVCVTAWPKNCRYVTPCRHA